MSKLTKNFHGYFELNGIELVTGDRIKIGGVPGTINRDRNGYFFETDNHRTGKYTKVYLHEQLDAEPL